MNSHARRQPITAGDFWRRRFPQPPSARHSTELRSRGGDGFATIDTAAAKQRRIRCVHDPRQRERGDVGDD